MTRSRGNLNDKIDRVLLHEYLWVNRDRNDYVPWTQQELAEKLGVTVFTLSRIFGEMKDNGWVEKVRGKYRVYDPSIAAWNRPKGSTLF